MSGFGIVRMKTDESRKAGVSRSVPGNGLGGDQRRSPRSRLRDRNDYSFPITHAEIIATVHLKTLPDSQQTFRHFCASCSGPSIPASKPW